MNRNEKRITKLEERNPVEKQEYSANHMARTLMFMAAEARVTKDPVQIEKLRKISEMLKYPRLMKGLDEDELNQDSPDDTRQKLEQALAKNRELEAKIARNEADKTR